MQRLCTVKILPSLALVIAMGLSMTGSSSGDQAPVSAEVAQVTDGNSVDQAQDAAEPTTLTASDNACVTCIDRGQSEVGAEQDAADAPAANNLRLTLSRSA